MANKQQFHPQPCLKHLLQAAEQIEVAQMALDGSKRDHARAVMALDQRAATVQQQEAAMAEAKAAAATKSKELDLREVGTT